jgi:hypothetical protein
MSWMRACILSGAGNTESTSPAGFAVNAGVQATHRRFI